MGTSILIGIIIFVVFVIWINYTDKKNKAEEAFNDASAKADYDSQDAYKEIDQVEKALVKTIADNEDNGDLVYFIKAMHQNYRLLRHKLLLVRRKEREGFYSWDLEANAKVGDQAIKDLYECQAPIYNNYATMVDSETLDLYMQLSNYYTALQLKIEPKVDNGYNLDWSNDYFYYVKVNDCKIPQFISDKKERLYIYPSAMIVNSGDIEFEIVPLPKVKLDIKKTEVADKTMAILTIKDYNLVIATENVDAAEKFYETFKKLQSHLRNVSTVKKLDNTEDNSEGNINHILNQVNSLVGLSQVKEDFVTIANYIKIQQIRQLKGLKVQTVSYHCVFTGNPGTGKTTIARMLADVYKELGVVSSGHLVEVDRSKLVGEYVGQTAVKTNAVIDEALDGILFIDEAYSLVQGGKDDYGAEAISTLLKRMEDDRDRLVVVLAGYSDEMKKFIESNPGLQSRFTRYLYFEDYSASELREIIDNLFRNNDYILSPAADEALTLKLENAVAGKTKNFGNARYVRNLFEKICERQATRLSGETELVEEQLRTIQDTDIP